MRRISVKIIFLGILLAGCGPTKNTIRTVHIPEASSETQAGIIYALPQTVLKITVDLLEVKTYRGPYYRFAEKYLGITGVAQENITEWYLTRVELDTELEADPDWFFAVYPEDGRTCCPELFNLSAEGLLVDVNRLIKQPDKIDKTIHPQYEESLLFTDVSIYENEIIRTDTLYKTILTDTTFIRIPVLREQSVSKTIDEKAEEAAEFILDLRERRIDLITGEYDFYPEETALETGLKKMTELEEEYLSLFIGKTIEIPHRHEYYYIPKPGELYENIELFEYSEAGATKEISGKGNLVSLRIRNTDKTGILTEYYQKLLSPEMNIIYYRIPDMAEVEIHDRGKTILKSRIPISQYGAILSLPVSE
ncbi:MAG: hypothetical protein AMS27_09385 [Bacteroides sp. SM23_62_1]|nr:MAG: hypothetical protein AMS27_09385 [Bacteroides sp. SM23_62_1]